MNTECSTLEGAPFHGDDEVSLRACATSAASFRNLHFSLDGASVPESTLQAFYVSSPMFDLSVPAGNTLSVQGPAVGQSVAVGVHLFLRPLPPGEHVLNFGGTAAAYDFTIDITYFLTVKS
jgi:hypothetical protein